MTKKKKIKEVEIPIEGDFTPLVEKAVRDNGTSRIKIIAAGGIIASINNATTTTIMTSIKK